MPEVNNRLLLWDLKKDPDYRLVEAPTGQDLEGMWAENFLVNPRECGRKHGFDCIFESHHCTCRCKLQRYRERCFHDAVPLIKLILLRVDISRENSQTQTCTNWNLWRLKTHISICVFFFSGDIVSAPRSHEWNIHWGQVCRYSAGVIVMDLQSMGHSFQWWLVF